MKYSLIILSLALCVPFFSWAGGGASPTYTSRPVLTEELNQKGIHELYNNGDFEKVIDVLERFQKNNPDCSFSDSVFIAKHLAVVYSAAPETREKGRYYMMRLLELVPTAKLVDMFVSEEVDRIFEKVREEFLAKRHGFGLDSLTIVVPPGSSNSNSSSGLKNPEQHESGKMKYWIAGGAAFLTLGATAFTLWVLEEPKGKPREIFVPRETP